MKKLLEKKGETLTETLASTLIIAMTMTMVAGAVVAAARVNDRADNSVNTLHVSGATTVSGVTFVLEPDGTSAWKTGDDLNNYTVKTEGSLRTFKVYRDHQEGKHDFYFFE